MRTKQSAMGYDKDEKKPSILHIIQSPSFGSNSQKQDGETSGRLKLKAAEGATHARRTPFIQDLSPREMQSGKGGGGAL